MTSASSASGSISRAAARRAARSLGELSAADLEDRVGVEAVERAQVDQPRRSARGRAASRRCRRRACPRARCVYSSTATSAAPAARSRRRCSAGAERRRRPAATISSKSAGSSRRRLDLDALPEPDLRARRRASAPRRGRRGTASRRPVIASSRSASGAWSRANSRNSASPTVSSGERAALPDAELVGVEDRAPDVVELEVALEADRPPTARPGRAPRSPPGAPGPRRSRRGSVSRPPSPSWSS